MENLVFTQLSISEVRELFREELDSFFVDNQISNPSITQERKVVDLKELLTLRPIIGSKSTLYKLTAKGLIPHAKKGKKLYFDLEEIDRWLMSYRVSTIEEISSKKFAGTSQNKSRRNSVGKFVKNQI